MSGTTDNIKGRAKSAAGELTDDDELRNEGKLDQAKGTVKDKATDAKEWVEDKVDDIADKVKRR